MFRSLLGLFAPEGTPAEDVARLIAACASVLPQPDFRRELLASGNLPAAGSAGDFARAIRAQSSINARLVAGIGRH